MLPSFGISFLQKTILQHSRLDLDPEEWVIGLMRYAMQCLFVKDKVRIIRRNKHVFYI